MFLTCHTGVTCWKPDQSRDIERLAMGVPKGTLSRLRGGLQRFKMLMERLEDARQHPQELSAQL